MGTEDTGWNCIWQCKPTNIYHPVQKFSVPLVITTGNKIKFLNYPPPHLFLTFTITLRCHYRWNDTQYKYGLYFQYMLTHTSCFLSFSVFFMFSTISTQGRYRSVSIVTCMLRAECPGARIPVGARLSAPIQTSPGADLAPYTMSTGPFKGVKWPGHGIDHPPLSTAEVEERVEVYLYSPSGPLRPVLGSTLPFTFTTSTLPK
jgi:hypothetical protein